MRKSIFWLALSFWLSTAPSHSQTIKSPAPQTVQLNAPLGGQPGLGAASRPNLIQDLPAPGLMPAAIGIQAGPAFIAPLPSDAQSAQPAAESAVPVDPKVLLKQLHESLEKAGPGEVSAREQELKAAFDNQAPRAAGSVKYQAEVEEGGVIRIVPYHNEDDDAGDYPTDEKGNPAVVSEDDAKLAPLLPSALEKAEARKGWTGRITLHLHSLFSDGTMTPEKVVEDAYAAGVRVLALTDHDTTAGVVRAWKKAKELGMEFHPGAEMTARGGAHVGAVDIDIYNPKLVALLGRVRIARWARANAVIKHLNKLPELKRKNIVLTMAEVEAKSSHNEGGTIELPHVARVLLDKGLIKSVDEAFETYLKGDIAGESGAEPDPKVEEVLEAIHAAGGKAILNHPYTVRGKDDRQQDARVDKILAAGMDGIEAYRPSNATSENGRRRAEERVKKYLALADKHDLFAAPGADFHGLDTHLDHLVVWMPKILAAQTQERLKDANAKALASLEAHNQPKPPAPAGGGVKLMGLTPLAMTPLLGPWAGLGFLLWLAAAGAALLGLHAWIEARTQKLSDGAQGAITTMFIWSAILALLGWAGLYLHLIAA